MRNISLSDILELSVSERIKLTQVIWDSIVEFPEAVPLTEAQRNLLDERLNDLKKNPDSGSPWPEVKARILGSR
jgi:putative addiction module component (TIGR02574 family)